MARGNSSALGLGPGYLYFGPLGTTEPTDLVTAWTAVSAAWTAIGYTSDGSEMDYNPATSPVDVAEELDHIQMVTTGRDATVKFAMSQITATNMKLAYNGGVLTTGTGIVTFEPPDLGTETRIMLGFQSEDGTERWVYRQCFQTGTVTLGRHKGANNATIATEFALEKPATGSRLFKAIFQTPLRQLPGRGRAACDQRVNEKTRAAPRPGSYAARAATCPESDNGRDRAYSGRGPGRHYACPGTCPDQGI